MRSGLGVILISLSLMELISNLVLLCKVVDGARREEAPSQSFCNGLLPSC